MRFATVSALAMALVVPLAAAATAQNYPSRTVTVVVPFPAGGSVDGVARITAIEPDAACQRLTIEAPAALAPLIATKGSVTLDGVSLTVNAVENGRFGIAIIPHTLTHTAFGDKKPGDGVNLEVDLFARYVARLMEMRR